MHGHEVSLFRLYLLRVTYLIIGAGLGILIWPGVINPPKDLEHLRGVVRALLAGVGLLALLGIRYPLRMLPLLLFELTWKSIWMIAFGLPRYFAGTLNEGLRQTWFDCLVSVPLFLVAIPWPYVWKHYVRERGDRWTGTARVAAGGDVNVTA